MSDPRLMKFQYIVWYPTEWKYCFILIKRSFKNNERMLFKYFQHLLILKVHKIKQKCTTKTVGGKLYS